MSFLRTLLTRLGFGGAPAATPSSSSDLRLEIEAAVDADDADRLAKVLRPHREDGKILIREYEGEIGEETEEAKRTRLAKYLTALVAVYANAFGDREPLEWFRRPGDFPELEIVVPRLEEAKKHLLEGNPEEAERLAESALRLLENVETEDSRLPALRSALFGLLAGRAMRAQDLSAAGEQFARSLAEARKAGDQASMSAALLNRIDYDTRRGMFAESIPLLDEAEQVVADSSFENLLGKLLVGRGVGQMRAGELADAEATFDRAVRLRPDWPFPYYQRAWTLFASGDSSAALADFRASAERASPFFTVQREIRCLEDVAAGSIPLDVYRAYCSIRDAMQENPARVEETADRILADFPNFPPVLLLKAETRLAGGDADAGREFARRALLHDPDPDTASAALFLEWNTARAAGDEAAMNEAAERLVSAYGDHPAARAVARFREDPARNHAMRWTWSMEGELVFEDMPPTDPGRTPPPPGSPG